jgi:hypothetical protein
MEQKCDGWALLTIFIINYPNTFHPIFSVVDRADQNELS